MTFLPHTIYLSLDDMVTYILAIPTTGWSWKPVGITWHNTGNPTLKMWDAYPQAVKNAWGDNLDHYYRTDPTTHWHAGPHAAGTPDEGIVLGEFTANGVHSRCYNSDHFGIETVGDFRTGGDDPLTGRGLLSMQSSANIIAALCKRMNWVPGNVINFHRQCTQDHHACPGDLVTDAWALGLVTARLAVLNGSSPAPIAPPAPVPTPNALTTAASAMVAAVLNFQKAAGLREDGDPGPATRAAFLAVNAGR